MRLFVSQFAKLWKLSPFFVILFFLGIPLTVASSVLSIYLPSYIVKDIETHSGLESLLFHIAILGGCTLLITAVSFVLGTVRSKRIVKINRFFVNQCLERGLRADYSRIENNDYENGVENIVQFSNNGTFSWDFMSTTSEVLSSVLGIVFYTGLLSKVSFILILSVILATAVSYFYGLRCNKWESANCQKWLSCDNKSAYISSEFSVFENGKDVRLFGMSPFLALLYKQVVRRRLLLTGKMQFNYWRGMAVDSLMTLVKEGLAYGYLIYLIVNNEITASEFVLYFGAVTGFGAWCGNIVDKMKHINLLTTYLKKREDFEKLTASEDESDKPDLDLKGEVPEIVLKNVSFKYPLAEEDTLKSLNITFRPGENIAIVGLNGAGKTTLVKLLAGLYNPTSGEILLNGKNRADYKSSSVHNITSAVFQDKCFFPFTLKENVILGEKEDSTKLEECLKKAGIYDKIMSLPKGLDSTTDLQTFEDAVKLSGGEEQKVLLARALYKDASVLLLDEPTSALDPITESELYKQYGDLAKGKTTFFISHRLASTRFCDRIIYMADGEIKEVGTHDELMAKQGAYAELFETQSKYYKEGETGEEVA